MSNLTGLDSKLRSIAAGYSGKCTYALTHLTSGERIGSAEDDVMPTASLIKVPILVALYQAIHDGAVGPFTDRITLTDDHRCLGSGVLSHLASGVEMSVRAAAVLMIIISDNTATNMMIDHGWPRPHQRDDATPRPPSHHDLPAPRRHKGRPRCSQDVSEHRRRDGPPA